MAPLARCIHSLAWLTGHSRRRAQAMRVMRVIMLHGVGDPRFTSEAFNGILRDLTKHYEVIPLEEVLRRLKSQRRITGHEIALTFDDGLRNNVTVAWPALREYGIPAAFFICPGLIDGKRWLWNHEACARLERLDKVGRAEIRATLDLPGLPEAVHDPYEVVQAMKALDLRSRLEAEETIRHATPGFVPSAELRRRHDMMTWGDLGTVDQSLITIGSHTRTHPILPTLDDESLLEEVAGSRRRLETAIGRPVEYFCYPNGMEDERVRDCVAEHYEAAVGTTPGWIRAGDDPYRLRRIGVSPTRATLAWRMHRP